jgi:hypothetical protein
MTGRRCAPRDYQQIKASESADTVVGRRQKRRFLLAPVNLLTPLEIRRKFPAPGEGINPIPQIWGAFALRSPMKYRPIMADKRLSMGEFWAGSQA